jgi:hypothetical protein
VVVLAAVLLTASSCGASDKPTEQLLRSNFPLLYVQIKGPAGAVNKIANSIETGAFTKIRTRPVPPYRKDGSFVPPQIRRHRVCLRAETIQTVDSPQLQPWLGKKITFIVYGNKSRASAIYCGLLGGVMFAAH